MENIFLQDGGAQEKKDKQSDNKLKYQQKKAEQAEIRKKEARKKKCEDEIDALEKRLKEIDEELSLDEVGRDPKRCLELSKEQSGINDKLEELMTLWEALEEE